MPKDDKGPSNMDELRRHKLQLDHTQNIYEVKAKTVVDTYEAFVGAHQHSGKTLGDMRW